MRKSIPSFLAATLSVSWWAGLLLFALVVASLATLEVLASRAAVLRAAEARVQSLAQIFVEHADLAINDGDKLIVAVQPIIATWDLKDPVRGREIYEEMRKFISGSPQIAAAWILDREGISVLDTWTYPSRRIDSNSRLYFTAHTSGAADPVIAGQEVGSVTGKRRFTVSRVVRGPEGEIHAIVVVAVYSEYLAALYRSAAAWPSATARLFVVRDGRVEVLARMVEPSDLPAGYREHLLPLIRKRPQGVETLHLSSGPRVVGWHSSRSHPGLFSATSQSVSAALEQWRFRSAVIAGTSAMTVLGFALLAVYATKEERARRQLEQQQLLMREVHHRVKNNLAIVASIINAGARHLGFDEKAQDQFRRVGAQVSSMAALYDLMQHAPGANKLAIDDLLAALCRELSKSTDRDIRYLPGEPVVIDADRSVSIMIIVNELVTNSIKHSTGPVAVSCTGSAEEASIRVESQHGEFPATFDFGAQDGFGLRMAQTLASSLGGSIEIVSLKPAAIRLSFPS